MIFSDKVLTGGAGLREAKRLKAEQEENTLGKRISNRISGLSGGGGGGSTSRGTSRTRVDEWDDGMADKFVDGDDLSRQSTRRMRDREVRRSRRQYGEPEMVQAGSRRESRGRSRLFY